MSLPPVFDCVSHEEKGSLRKVQEVPLGGLSTLPQSSDFYPLLLTIFSVICETRLLRHHQPLHLLMLLLFIPSKHTLPAPATASISEMKFLINSVC